MGCHFLFVGRCLPSSKQLGWSLLIPPPPVLSFRVSLQCRRLYLLQTWGLPQGSELGDKDTAFHWGVGLLPLPLGPLSREADHTVTFLPVWAGFLGCIPVESLFVNICSRKCHFIITQLPLILISCSKARVQELLGSLPLETMSQIFQRGGRKLFPLRVFILESMMKRSSNSEKNSSFLASRTRLILT